MGSPPREDRDTGEQNVPELLERELTAKKPDVIAYRMREAEKALKLGAARFAELDHKISIEVQAVKTELAGEIAALKPKVTPPLKLWSIVGGAVFAAAVLLWQAGELVTTLRFEIRMLREDIEDLRKAQERKAP